MIDIIGIAIREEHLASNETRDDLMRSSIWIGDSQLHLVRIDDGPEGVTRTYCDREDMRARTALLVQESMASGERFGG